MIHDGTRLLSTPFLDISALVSCCGERGLIGLAFHPRYATNGLFYVNYTNTAGDVVIARYAASSDPNRAQLPGAPLLTVPKPAPNHNGGQLAFGPDGYLYIGVGDGGGAGDVDNNAQNLGSLLGKILRIDVDGPPPYGIPAANPFVGMVGARAEIWAYGLRNPWRFSFDRLTGDLFIGDVGQNAWEEIDFQPASSPGGENYGWRRMEGTHCFNPLTDCNNGMLMLPIIEYPHGATPAECSVTGGYRYRGAAVPDWAGHYVFGDLCSGRIRAATPNGATWTINHIFDTSFQITTFGEDETGELYVARYHETDGAVYRIAPMVAPGRPQRDFDGDGKADILWRHTSGALYEWRLDGTRTIGGGSLGGVSTDWSIAGLGDFNGDSKADILWRHSSGAVYIWLIDGTNRSGEGSLGVVPTEWSIAGIGDFNGDGKADILWHHTSGCVYLWLLNGTSRIGDGSLGCATTDWTIAGIGDFDGDGNFDILWYHPSGCAYLWLLDGTSKIGEGSLGCVGPDWRIAGVGDFNRDGKADILWRHTSGALYIWLLNGTSRIDERSLGGVSTDWGIAGVADFNGDNSADILWRHISGAVYIWLISDTSRMAEGSLGLVSTDWLIQ
jgi:glucose/arabinose dehydrogenase